MLRLRRVDEAEARLTAAADAWRARGWAATLEHLPRMGTWIQVQDTSHTWQGWVEPGMWLEGVSHELASLACSADSERLAARLFAVSSRPLHLPMPELRYAMLDVASPIEGAALPEGRLLKVRAAECPVWLTRVPAVETTQRLDAGDVRVFLDMEIGRSRTTTAMLRSTGRGDLLLIRDTRRRVSCRGLTIGSYLHEEGRVMLDFDEPGATDAGDDREGFDARTPTPAPTPLEHLPVELVFVLQRERMTFAELQQVGRTRMLALQPGAEQHVEVRVNDTLLARGELVQLDGRLGVEIGQWYAGNAHVE